MMSKFDNPHCITKYYAKLDIPHVVTRLLMVDSRLYLDKLFKVNSGVPGQWLFTGCPIEKTGKDRWKYDYQFHYKKGGWNGPYKIYEECDFGELLDEP